MMQFLIYANKKPGATTKQRKYLSKKDDQEKMMPDEPPSVETSPLTVDQKNTSNRA